MESEKSIANIQHYQVVANFTEELKQYFVHVLYVLQCYFSSQIHYYFSFYSVFVLTNKTQIVYFQQQAHSDHKPAMWVKVCTRNTAKLLLLLLLLLLQYLQRAQIQASLSQRRWYSKVEKMASWEGKRGVLRLCLKDGRSMQFYMAIYRDS